MLWQEAPLAESERETSGGIELQANIVEMKPTFTFYLALLSVACNFQPRSRRCKQLLLPHAMSSATLGGILHLSHETVLLSI